MVTGSAKARKRKKLNKNNGKLFTLKKMPVAARLFVNHKLCDTLESFLYVYIPAAVALLVNDAYNCLSGTNTGGFCVTLALFTVCVCWVYLIRLPLRYGVADYPFLIVVILGLFSFGLSFTTLYLFHHHLDFNLQAEYLEFCGRLSHFLVANDVAFRFSLPYTGFLLGLSLLASMITGAFFWPVMRYAKTYNAITTYKFDELFQRSPSSRGDTMLRTACHVSFFLPLLCIVAWIPAMSKDPLLRSGVTLAAFSKARLLLLLAACALRLALFWRFVQVYLSSTLIMMQRHLNDLTQETGENIRLLCQQRISTLPEISLENLLPTSLLLLMVLVIKVKADFNFGVCDCLVGASEAPATADALAIGDSPLLITVLSFLVWWGWASWFVWSSVCQLYIRSGGARSL